MVYEPREDSFLLADVVRARARGRVLDMGTGSGVQALAALERAESVLAVDVDPEAVAAARAAGVDARLSDLFSAVDGVFDVIVANTPYLPSEPTAPDVALDGGPRGFEWTLRFLDHAKHFLAPEGEIIFLISSLTRPEVVERRLRELAFVWEVVARQSLAFEELLVYSARHALPQRPGAVFVARGKRGRVYRDGDVAIKVAEPRRVAQEVRMLERVNAWGLGPRLFSHGVDWLEMRFVEGPRLEEYLARCSRAEAVAVLSEVIRQLRLLDYACIMKRELKNPYKHIIVSAAGPVQIDWERARPSARPRNLAQFAEYLLRLSRMFPRLRLNIDSLLALAPAERVYAVVASIPAGKTLTYGEVARRASSSPRAVGQALRRNPYAPVVPCHRVVASDGSLGGFRGRRHGSAVEEKAELLRSEGVPVVDNRVRSR